MTKDRIWKKFKIEDIFTITGSKTTKVDELVESDEEDREFPYITTRATNNGVDGFFKYRTEKGGVLTFDSATVGYVSYQSNDFSASDHVEIMKPINFVLNKYNAHFIITSINKAINNKFNYGFKLSQTRMRKQIIQLPVKNQISNQPDYEYMENIVKKQFDSKYEKYINYIESRLKELDYKIIPSITDKEWQDFPIIEIFDKIQRGKRLTKSNQVKGTIPYISSTALNNGVSNYISNTEKVRRFSNCLTVANSGSIGSSFYHPYEFVASDHVTHFKNHEMSSYIYLFISVITNNFKEKYNFNREINDKRIKREKILLPINCNNEPDYLFMEQYIKNLMIKKYNQYKKNLTENFYD